MTRLTLTDFRCYGHQRIEADARPVVLVGPNGAGKTNALEAVSFLVPGRGLRRARLAEVTRHGAAAWAVAARIEAPTGPVDLGTGLDPASHRAARGAGGGEKRVVHVDGRPVRSQAVLAEHLHAVWLTPQMDRLFLEGAAGRRRFLDRLVFGFDPAHAGRASAYENALRQRARLLRDGGADPAWLTALEETMATRGVAVAAARRDLVGRLAVLCAAGSGPFPGADVAVAGLVEGWLEQGPALVAEDRFRGALAAGRAREAAGGGGDVAGPHRSDLMVRHRAKGVAAAQCSTGEQKALLIAIVLAVARLQAAERGTVPVLLLDEVAAHLDRPRREALFEALLMLGGQAWLTGTDRALFAPLAGRARFLAVEDAAIRALEG